MNSYANRQREAHRKIKREGMRKYFTPVIATDIVTGEEYEFECVMDAENKGFANHRNIFACIAGSRRTTGGYYWRRKND